MKNRGFTQMILAPLIGVTQGQLSHYFTGKSIPRRGGYKMIMNCIQGSY